MEYKTNSTEDCTGEYTADSVSVELKNPLYDVKEKMFMSFKELVDFLKPKNNKRK